MLCMDLYTLIYTLYIFWTVCKIAVCARPLLWSSGLTASTSSTKKNIFNECSLHPHPLSSWSLTVSVSCVGHPAADPIDPLATAAFCLSRLNVISKAQTGTEANSVQHQTKKGQTGWKCKWRYGIQGEEINSQEASHAATNRFCIAAVDLKSQEDIGVTQRVEQVHVGWPLGTVHVAAAHEDLCHKSPRATTDSSSQRWRGKGWPRWWWGCRAGTHCSERSAWLDQPRPRRSCQGKLREWFAWQLRPSHPRLSGSD